MEPKREFPSVDNLETCQTKARGVTRLLRLVSLKLCAQTGGFGDLGTSRQGKARKLHQQVALCMEPRREISN